MKYFIYLTICVLSFIFLTLLMSFVNRMTYDEPIISEVPESQKIITQEVIQLNILNGSGVKGLASNTKDYLRHRGFDIVEIGNSQQPYNKTTIIDRLGDKESVRRLAYAIGVPDSSIIVQIDSSLFLRATLIIGNDYQSLRSFK